jgi:hypothetical protein
LKDWFVDWLRGVYVLHRVPVGTTEGPVLKKAKFGKSQEKEDVEKHSNTEPLKTNSLTRE